MSKIIGNTTVTPMAIPDWEQNNPFKADYIKNKPDFDGLSDKVDNISEKVGTESVADQISTAIDGLATETYVNNATNAVKNDLLNCAGEAYDTLKELGELIDENKDAIDALEEIAISKADKNHNHDDLYYTKAEIDNISSQKSQVQIITWEADD